MKEKERLERRALAFFLRLYYRKFETKYRLLEKRERPDFLVRDKISEDIVGVEISHIFHDKKEAMMMLGRSADHIHGIITAEDHVNVMMRVLQKKAEKVKQYPFDGPIMLVLRDFSALFDPQSIIDYHLGLKVPKSDYFEVWYLTRSGTAEKWDHLMQIQ